MKQSPSEVKTLLETALNYMEVFTIRGEEPLVGENLKIDLFKIRSAIESLKIESPSEEGKETDKEIKKIEWLIWHGVQATCEENCHCHAECNKADEFIETFKSKYTIEELEKSENQIEKAKREAWIEGLDAGWNWNENKGEEPNNPYSKKQNS